MHRIEEIVRYLNLAPPKWLQALAVLAVGLVMPLYLLRDTPIWTEHNWSIGALVCIGAWALVVAGCVLWALGITGGNVTITEQDKQIGERLGRYYPKI